MVTIIFDPSINNVFFLLKMFYSKKKQAFLL